IREPARGLAAAWRCREIRSPWEGGGTRAPPRASAAIRRTRRRPILARSTSCVDDVAAGGGYQIPIPMGAGPCTRNGLHGEYFCEPLVARTRHVAWRYCAKPSTTA